MIDKEQVENHFHKASSSYDDVARIQRECGEFLINKLEKTLPSFNPSSILDLGTGTGYLPELLLKKFPTSSYGLNDIADGMLQKVRQQFDSNDQFSFILGDMENLDFAPHDLITSNFALQWVDNFNATITKIYKSSNVFAFSCLLDGTFEEWREIFEAKSLPPPTYEYPSQKAATELLLSLKPKECFVEARDYKMTFSSSLAFMRHLKQLGASTPSHTISLTDLRNLINTNDQEITVTYRVFFGILRRI